MSVLLEGQRDFVRNFGAEGRPRNCWRIFVVPVGVNVVPRVQCRLVEVPKRAVGGEFVELRWQGADAIASFEGLGVSDYHAGHHCRGEVRARRNRCCPHVVAKDRGLCKRRLCESEPVQCFLLSGQGSVHVS